MTTRTLVVHYKSDDIMVSEDQDGRLTIEALNKDGGSVEIPKGEAAKLGKALAALRKN